MILRGTNSAWWVTARLAVAGAAVGVWGVAATPARGDNAASTADAPAATAIADSPVSIEAVYLDTEAGPIRGYLARVDLTDARVEVVVSDGAGSTLEPPEAEVVLTPTDAFVADTGCVLAVNANFFNWLEVPSTGKKTDADIVGLSVTDGQVVSPARKDGDAGDPALVFGKDGRARVLYLTPEQAQSSVQVWDGVAGTGGSDGGHAMGTLLVIDGVNHGDTALPGPNVRHPRTAAGVDRDGNTLILAVFDGRQPEHSIGITLVELGAVMIDAGADDALNLDGGGSTALLCWSGLLAGDPTAAALPDPDGDGWITNSPSDGRYRAVANHLGIRLRGVTPPHPPVPFVGTPRAVPGKAPHE